MMFLVSESLKDVIFEISSDASFLSCLIASEICCERLLTWSVEVLKLSTTFVVSSFREFTSVIALLIVSIAS